ncbi:MAG: lysostaphin resistance A-like protein [Pseudohongiellaceae bacterium]
MEEKASLDKYTLIALIISLVLYPLLYSLDFFSSILFPLLSDESINNYFGRVNRVSWWLFWLSNMFYHWIPFFFIWLAIYKNKEKWSSIGINFGWYLKYKWWFICFILALILAALFLPGIYYGNELPESSSIGFFGPIGSIERLFAIFISFTAAFTEEVLFRGYAFTRLKRWIPNPWFILPITLVSFLLIHGEPESLNRVLFYILGGCAFGIPFILMGLKRLEIIILVHFIIDVSTVFAP